MQEVQRLYLADYAARWSAYVADLRLAPTTDLASSAELAQSLSRDDSPLVAVLKSAVREVSLGASTASGSASTSGTAANASNAADATLGPRFDELATFVSGQPAPIDDTRALLAKVSTRLASIDDAVKRKTVPPPSDINRELQAAAQRAPEPVRSMLTQLAARSSAQEFNAIKGPLGAKLATELAPACQRAVGGHYPMSRSAGDDMSRDDFAKTFGAGGLMDSFFQRNLAAYVDTSTRPWTYRAGGAALRGDSGESLVQFERAQTIRDTYFREGGRQLGARLDFRLIELDPAISEFLLDVDGQVLRFRPGAQAAQSVQWPGPAATGRVNLQLASGGAAGNPHVFQGAWSLFRLLDRVRSEPGATPDRMQLAFDVEGRKAKFEVKSATPLNPMLRRELEQFQCPTRL